MPVTTEVLFMIGGGFVTALVWLIRLEGRVNTHDVQLKQLRQDLVHIRDRCDAIFTFTQPKPPGDLHR